MEKVFYSLNKQPQAHFRPLVVVLALLISISFASEPQNDTQVNGFGLYGSAWVSWLRGNPTNVDFIIYQVGPSRPLGLIRDDLQFASDSGTKIILTLKSRKVAASNPAMDTSAPSLENFTRILDRIADLPLAAVTIGEENVFWDGRSEWLASLYETLHERYPERRFFQWYSPSRNLNIPGRKWPALPADGWVFDQYHMHGQIYREYLNGMADIDLPKVSVVWASPLWRPGARKGEPNFEWWDQEGWKLFYNQVRLNIDHNLPTAFFLYELAESGRQPIPMFRSENNCAHGFVDAFLNQTLPALRFRNLLVALPAERPEWIPSGCSE